MKLYKVIARPILTYVCKTWPTTLENERKLAIEEKRFLRTICGSKINNVTLRYEIRSNEEVYNAFGEPNIIGLIRVKRLIWLGHILSSNIIAKEILNWKPQ